MWGPGNLPGKPVDVVNPALSQTSVFRQKFARSQSRRYSLPQILGMLHRSPIPLARRGTSSAPPLHQLFMSDPTLAEFPQYARFIEF